MTAHHPTRSSVPNSPGGFVAAPEPGAAGPSAPGGTVGRPCKA
ncbi:hypothetical protein ACF9IK_32170 [Kitasatospora hibisci]